MTTRTFEVGGLLSVLGTRGIEKQVRRVRGVERVSVNPVNGTTTVTYDADEVGVAAIRQAIENCGFHCAGEALTRHICGNEHAEKV